MTDRQGRNRNLDLIKGFCILLIILTHFYWTDYERLRFLFPFWVEMAVPIFMIISGYVYSLSFQRHNIDSISKAYRVKNVLTKVIRYTIPFLVVFIAEIIVYIIKSGEIDDPISILYFFLKGANGPGSYYYPILLQFVFVFPIIFFIIKKLDFKGLVICTIINFVYEVLQSAYYVNEECYRLLVFRYIMVIAFGCYLAIGKRKIKWYVFLTAFFVGLVYIIVFNYLGITPIFTKYWTGTSFWACMYILPIAAFWISRKNLKFKPLEIIGKASYNIFLVQMFYYAFIANMLYSVIKNYFFQLTTNFIICLVLGIIFYYIEYPITNKTIYKITNKKRY